MEIEYLRNYALLVVLKRLKLQCCAGHIEPLVEFIHKDEIEAFHFDGHLLNDSDTKRVLFNFLQGRAHQQGAQAVIFGWDAYCLLKNPEAMRRVDPDELKELDLDRLVALGLGRKYEVINIVVQTPIFVLSIEQPYERINGSIRFGDIQTFDDSKTGVRLMGGMSMFKDSLAVA